VATYEERQSAVLGTTVAWLEDELREAKTLIARQQQAIEQLTGQIWELTDALHRAEDLLGTVPPRLEILPEYDTQLRGLKDELSRLHERELAVDSRVNELARAQQSDAERERAVLNDLVRRMEDAERGVQGGLPRFDALDEASRRAIEVATAVRQRLDELERSIEALDSRLTRVVESGGRTEQEFARIGGEIEALHRQDATLGERVQIYTEMLRRLEAQISVVSSEVAVKQDVLERIELTRVGLHRLEERISVQEAVTTELREADEDSGRQVAMLEGRDKGLYDRLTGLQNDLANYRAVVSEQFHRLHQAQERARRRQIEDLEREIRELRTHAFRPVEDGS
jgi:DNA repair exonuclease SbcCD ATPase subunit